MEQEGEGAAMKQIEHQADVIFGLIGVCAMTHTRTAAAFES